MTKQIIKLFLIVSIFLTSGIWAFSQRVVKKTIPQRVVKNIIPNLLNINDVIEHRAFDKILWQLASYTDVEEKDIPVNSKNVFAYVDRYLSYATTADISSSEKNECILIKKYITLLDSTFQDFELLPSGDKGKFVFIKDKASPIHFGLFNDTALSLIINSLFVDNVYNTLRLTARQRATKVIEEYVLPQLIVFIYRFKSSEIKYFGLTCVYGSKTFGDTDPVATKGEYVAFMASRKAISNYVTHKITEDELLNAADIYICDRTMGIGEIKKVKLQIE